MLVRCNHSSELWNGRPNQRLSIAFESRQCRFRKMFVTGLATRDGFRAYLGLGSGQRGSSRRHGSRFRRCALSRRESLTGQLSRPMSGKGEPPSELHPHATDGGAILALLRRFPSGRPPSVKPTAACTNSPRVLFEQVFKGPRLFADSLRYVRFSVVVCPKGAGPECHAPSPAIVQKAHCRPQFCVIGDDRQQRLA